MVRIRMLRSMLVGWNVPGDAPGKFIPHRVCVGAGEEANVPDETAHALVADRCAEIVTTDAVLDEITEPAQGTRPAPARGPLGPVASLASRVRG